MAVHKRSYRAYIGPVTPQRTRWWVITRYSLAGAFSSRVSVVLFVICLVPSLLAAVTIYVANSETARTLLELRNANNILAIDNRFFLRLMAVQGWLALFLTAWVGPLMVSPDLTNNALPLFLSRPISRAEYVAAKIAVLSIILSSVTWVPLLLLFLIQAQLSITPWLGPNLFIAGAVIVGSFLWIALLSLVALAISAYVRWRIVATGLMVAVIFIPAGFGAVVNAVLRTKWGMLLNVPYTLSLIWADLFRYPLPFQMVPVSAAWFSLLAVAAISLILLHKQVQARQVVRG
ncbi:MAG TPA: hypothetical protein VD837_12430 [Terriglobales bacterium]|nr:hypothetical protein [Terriglobales bacterium]